MGTFERTPGLVEQEVEGETVVLDKNAGLIHQLNPTASEIWLACDGKRTEEDIARVIAEKYDVEIEIARADVVSVLEQLKEQKLIQVI